MIFVDAYFFNNKDAFALEGGDESLDSFSARKMQTKSLALSKQKQSQIWRSPS